MQGHVYQDTHVSQAHMLNYGHERIFVVFKPVTPFHVAQLYSCLCCPISVLSYGKSIGIRIVQVIRLISDPIPNVTDQFYLPLIS